MGEAIIKMRGGIKGLMASLEITTAPTKKSYAVGDQLDLTGIVVTAIYKNGQRVDVTSKCIFSPANGATLTKDDTSVTVSFEWGEKIYTATQAIRIITYKIVDWASGTDEEIANMVAAADAGIIELADYWAVGDTRTVQLSAMSATGVGESHAAQQVDLVLMHSGGYDLNTAVESGRTKCNFIVGMKDCLAEIGYMNSSNNNSGSWNDSARRTWCNSIFKNAIPSTLLGIFKQFKTITAEAYNGNTNQTSVDYFALPAAKEVFGGSASSAGPDTSLSNLTEFEALFQFDWYKTASNRVKKLGKTGDAIEWWERSPRYSDYSGFCNVGANGNAYISYAKYTRGLAPFGCI